MRVRRSLRGVIAWSTAIASCRFVNGPRPYELQDRPRAGRRARRPLRSAAGSAVGGRRKRSTTTPRDVRAQMKSPRSTARIVPGSSSAAAAFSEIASGTPACSAPAAPQYFLASTTGEVTAIPFRLGSRRYNGRVAFDPGSSAAAIDDGHDDPREGPARLLHGLRCAFAAVLRAAAPPTHTMSWCLSVAQRSRLLRARSW